ncbi:phage baseplate assembly protein V [Nostoc parmelioides]|uniref:Phage tail protein n=1 Tax=Nostoc parmelioides FACHB-3921 TaxID=2692909 RepID=A0ABR8BGG9_9NOSO|nr:phage baseplate assembly protein V [Nostoc parmelioides]MBD2251980.1 phage tail protein [Nostoc parmelioides FACHB-3921]
MMGMALLAEEDQRDRLYGVMIGIVTNNQDPENMGRVKLKFPWLSDRDESYWARVVTPMAGAGRGLYFLPEVEDEVLVAFEHGQVEFPYVLGALWNGVDKPPIDNKNGKNNQRLIKSRSGHTILLDDTDGVEKVIIRDRTSKNEIVIDSSQNAIAVNSEKNITLNTKGTITLKTSGGDLVINCKNLKIQAQETVDIQAQTQCKVQANTAMALKCLAGVKINDGALEVL